MVRVVLTAKGEESYFEQFLWHMGSASVAANYFESFTEAERNVIAACLDYLFEHRSLEIEQECLEDELLAAMEFWCSNLSVIRP